MLVLAMSLRYYFSADQPLTSKYATDIHQGCLFAIQLELVVLGFLLFQPSWSQGWTDVEQATAFYFGLGTMLVIVAITSLGLFAPRIARKKHHDEQVR